LFCRECSRKEQFDEFLAEIFEEGSSEEDEEYSKEAWKKLKADMPSTEGTWSPLEERIAEKLCDSVWKKLNSEKKNDPKQSNPEVIHYEDWTNIVIDSATEISEKTPATKEQQSKFFKRELDWILCIHEGEGDINKDTLHNFIKDLIHRFVDCDRGITDAERVVRALRHISVGLSLIGAAVIYGRLL